MLCILGPRNAATLPGCVMLVSFAGTHEPEWPVLGRRAPAPSPGGPCRRPAAGRHDPPPPLPRAHGAHTPSTPPEPWPRRCQARQMVTTQHIGGYISITAGVAGLLGVSAPRTTQQTSPQPHLTPQHRCSPSAATHRSKTRDKGGGRAGEILPKQESAVAKMA